MASELTQVAFNPLPCEVVPFWLGLCLQLASLNHHKCVRLQGSCGQRQGDVKARATGGRAGRDLGLWEKPEAGAGADTADGRGKERVKESESRIGSL